MTAQPFTELTSILERAARNDTRAHLSPDLVRALIGSEAYSLLAHYRIRELTAKWQENEAQPAPQPGPNLGHSGYGIERSGMNGASAGMMTAAEQEAVERAESQRALAAVASTKSPRRLKTH